mmetsp:Transcript_22107/g.66441  ORF Transcript_22107/g.66441 Transcript_22107/m.66441 type:complete len:230 (-) Transcript_22107:194-883(-)
MPIRNRDRRVAFSAASAALPLVPLSEVLVMPHGRAGLPPARPACTGGSLAPPRLRRRHHRSGRRRGAGAARGPSGAVVILGSYAATAAGGTEEGPRVVVPGTPRAGAGEPPPPEEPPALGPRTEQALLRGVRDRDFVVLAEGPEGDQGKLSVALDAERRGGAAAVVGAARHGVDASAAVGQADPVHGDDLQQRGHDALRARRLLDVPHDPGRQLHLVAEPGQPLLQRRG